MAREAGGLKLWAWKVLRRAVGTPSTVVMPENGLALYRFLAETSLDSGGIGRKCFGLVYYTMAHQ
jgi:hypothetical protein